MLSVTQSGDTLTSRIPGGMTSPNVMVAAGTNLDDYSRSPLQVSIDGTTWAILDVSAVMDQGMDAAFDGGNTWVAVGSKIDVGGVVMYSTNGNVWNPAAMATHTNNTQAVCYSPNDSSWYIVGYDVCGRSVIKRNTNIGSTVGVWEAVCQNPSSAYFGTNLALGCNAAAYSIATDGGNTIVATGYSGEGNSAILYASAMDGTFWYNGLDADTNDVINGGGLCVAYNGNIWLATLNDYIYLSRDGKTWKRVFYSAAQADNRGVEWNGQYWLTNGYTGVYKSYDGYTWDAFVPGAGGFFNCLGWNGTRWLAGGYGINGTNTMVSLTATDVAWAPCVDFTNTSINVLFNQVNNFANRVLLPNTPPPPAAAVHTRNDNGGPPDANVGNIGDTYISLGANGKPTNTYGPKYEVASYGTGGAVFFSASQPYRNWAHTATGSPNYNIGTRDYTINWWMSSPVDVSASGPIFSIPAAAGVGYFGVTISSDNNLYMLISGDTVGLNTPVPTSTWTFCTLVRDGGVTTFYANGSNAYTDGGLYSTAHCGNSTSPVWFGSNTTDSTATTGLLMTNFRWTTSYVDIFAADVLPVPLPMITGTVLLFRATDGPMTWTDTVYGTPMTVPVFGGQPISIWSGWNPAQTVTLSWGAAKTRAPYQFYGFGVPTQDPPGSIPGIGDTYTDLNTGSVYTIDV